MNFLGHWEMSIFFEFFDNDFLRRLPLTCALKERNCREGEEKESHQDAPKGVVDQEFFHHCTVFFDLFRCQ